MPAAQNILPVVAMIAGFLVQNYAEWRGKGPRTKPLRGTGACR